MEHVYMYMGLPIVSLQKFRVIHAECREEPNEGSKPNEGVTTR